MKNINDLPYRLGVGMMLLNKEDEVFVGKRIDTKSEAWQMPQGGIDEGENPRDAVLRELEEEVGTNNVQIIAESTIWHYYDLPADLIPKIWNGKYRGQKQRWFVLRLLGNDSEINITTDHPEFCDWQWTAINTLTDIIVPFKRKIYSEIIEEFRDVITS